MDLFGEIEARKDDESAQIAFVKAYVAGIYGLPASALKAPAQGQQFYTLIGEDSVFRVARHPGISANMKNEAAVMRALHGRVAMPTPEVLDYQPDKHIMRIEKFSGEPLSREQLMTLEPEKREEIAERIGQFLGQMHQLLPQHGKMEPWWVQADKPVLKKAEKLLANETDAGRRERLKGIIDFCESPPETEDLVMTHGDVHPSNMIYDERTGFLGVIDFGSATPLPAYRDFFKLCRNFPQETYNLAVAAYERTTGSEFDRAKIHVIMDAYEVAAYGKLPARNQDASAVSNDPSRPGHPVSVPRNGPQHQ